MSDDRAILTQEDWDAIVDALEWAAEDMGEDLHDTQDSDFYDPDERAIRERTLENWHRIIKLLTIDKAEGRTET